jgi:hypothetical protein
MDPITFIMNAYGIQQADRAEFERTLNSRSPRHLDLAFRMMGQHPDDEHFDESLNEWPISMGCGCH